MKSTKTESERLDCEFWLSNAAERERRWATVKTDEEKAKADTRRFLLERFSKRQTREEQLVDLQDDFVGEAIILKVGQHRRLVNFYGAIGNLGERQGDGGVSPGRAGVLSGLSSER